MDKLKSMFDKIPWTSWGRETPISRLARSIVPVGNHSNVKKTVTDEFISSDDPAFENWIMDIEGTAFQCGKGKLLTCWHVCEALDVEGGHAYVHANIKYKGQIAKCHYPIVAQFSFIDPRTNSGNKLVDVGVLISPAKDTENYVYDVPPVSWGDSSQVGVGDRVLIGGFPLGKELFITSSTNRGIVQPTFYDGVISAILPAMQPGETRLFQISSVALGGISGGVVCTANSGKVIGMVTSGLNHGDISLPITYAIPSEVLRPWIESISFKTES